jgi:hypothetical protein
VQTAEGNNKEESKIDLDMVSYEDIGVWLEAYVDNDFEHDERQHRNLLHANDAYAFIVDICYTAVTISTELL